MAELNPERLRILVVEDDPAYRHMAREALDPHDRWIASTAERGMELFYQHAPNIVFLDISLPDENGMQVLLRIRENHPESFVVMLTASRLSDDVLLAQRCAANGYITKPFNRRQLVAYCEMCVKHWAKLEEMDVKSRAEFRAKIRSEAKRTREMLAMPAETAREALQRLMPRWKVLVAGNKAGQAQGWLRTLHDAGCQVDAAETGAAAIGKLRDVPFRLLLVEEELPDMDAGELLYQLRQAGMSLPTVVVVDAEGKLQDERWRSIGASQVVNSPVTDDKVRALVEREIARSMHDDDDVFLKV